MTPTAAARATTGRTPGPIAIGLLVVVLAAILMALVDASGWASTSGSSGARAPGGQRVIPRSMPSSPASSSAANDHQAATTTNQDASVTETDGLLPGGVTVFDGAYPGIANLDPALLRALRDAATTAADDGIELDVNSGWRSAAYQGRLLREAVADYGSEAAAARWVATPETSPHVSGDAVDIGPVDATAWLSAHGAAWGLCRIYRNEPWHFELRPNAIDRGCPRPYADPTQDPRLQP